MLTQQQKDQFINRFAEELESAASDAVNALHQTVVGVVAEVVEDHDDLTEVSQSVLRCILGHEEPPTIPEPVIDPTYTVTIKRSDGFYEPLVEVHSETIVGSEKNVKKQATLIARKVLQKPGEDFWMRGGWTRGCEQTGDFWKTCFANRVQYYIDIRKVQ